MIPGIEQSFAHKNGFRADLQGLRAISVLAVVAFHIKSDIVRGGFVGVDIFFVISGFIITSLLITQYEATGRIDLIEFLIKRSRRLLPNASLVLIFVLLAGIFIIPAYDYPTVVSDVISAALYYANFHFLGMKLDYFSSNLAPSPVVHFWSLSIEEQFYFVWPALLLILGGLAARLAIGARLFVSVVLGAIWLLSFATCVATIQYNQPEAFFGTATRIWELASGALLALQLRNIRWIIARHAEIIGAVGLAMIVLSIFLMSENMRHPGIITLIPVIGTMLTIAAGSHDGVPPWATLLLSVPRLGKIGDQSYSLYLWHWPVIVFAGLLFENSFVAMVLALPVMMCLSWLAYHFVERPIHRGPWLQGSKWQQATVAASLVVVVAGFGLTAKVIATSIQTAGAARWTQAIQSASDDRGAAYRDNCHLGGSEVAQPDCIYGDKNAARTAILFGDSHAAHWLPALERVGQEDGWAVRSWSKSVCPGAQITVWDPYRKSDYFECHQWRSEIIARMLQMSPRPVVFLSSSNGYDGWSRAKDGVTILAGAPAAQAFEDGLKQTANALIAGGVKVFIVRDTPLAEVKYKECIVKHLGGSGCERPRSRAINQNEMEKRAAAQTGAGFIDVSDLICDPSKCPVVKDGIVVYRDDSHMSAAFARTLADPFRAALGSIK